MLKVMNMLDAILMIHIEHMEILEEKVDKNVKEE